MVYVSVRVCVRAQGTSRCMNYLLKIIYLDFLAFPSLCDCILRDYHAARFWYLKLFSLVPFIFYFPLKTVFSKAFWAIKPLWKPQWVLAEEAKRSLLCIVHCTIVCHPRDILQVCAGLCSLTKASWLFISLLWQSVNFLHVLSAIFDDFLYVVYTNKCGILSFSQILVRILLDPSLCFLYPFLPVYFYSIIDEGTSATKSSSSLNSFCWLVCLCVHLSSACVCFCFARGTSSSLVVPLLCFPMQGSNPEFNFCEASALLLGYFQAILVVFRYEIIHYN